MSPNQCRMPLSPKRSTSASANAGRLVFQERSVALAPANDPEPGIDRGRHSVRTGDPGDRVTVRPG